MFPFRGSFPGGGGYSGIVVNGKCILSFHSLTDKIFVLCLGCGNNSDITPKTKEITLDIYDYEKTEKGESTLSNILFRNILLCSFQ